MDDKGNSVVPKKNLVINMNIVRWTLYIRPLFMWIYYCLTAILNWDQHPDSGQHSFYGKSLPLLNVFNTF